MLTQKLSAIALVGSEWILILMGLLSVISVAIIIERFLALRKLLNESNRVGVRAKEALQTSDFRNIEDLARSHDALEGRLVNYALRHISNKGVDGVEEIMNGYLLMERPNLEKNLGFLATLGANAPFIGLLGTVLGIIHAFDSLSTSQGDPSVVMKGISEALLATAVGLFVAIPAVVAFNYFQKQAKLILSNAESTKQLVLAYSRTSKKA